MESEAGICDVCRWDTEFSGIEILSKEEVK